MSHQRRTRCVFEILQNADCTGLPLPVTSSPDFHFSLIFLHAVCLCFTLMPPAPLFSDASSRRFPDFSPPSLLLRRYTSAAIAGHFDSSMRQRIVRQPASARYCAITVEGMTDAYRYLMTFHAAAAAARRRRLHHFHYPPSSRFHDKYG